MSSPETANLPQKAVLWMQSSYDRQGNATLAAPIEISCRWEDKQSEALDPQNQKIATEANVVVDRAITVGSVLWKGTKADLPTTPTNLKTVVIYSEVPDIKGRVNRRRVQLVKHSDTLPTLA